MADPYSTYSIAGVVKKIDERGFLLPAFQRKFVWSEDKITLLFDSIMQKYPISTFMFWHITNNNMKDYSFYEFNKELKIQPRRSETASIQNGLNHQPAHNPYPHDFLAVIDGQQRLTALYLGLKGKVRVINNKNSDQIEKFLYLNLIPNQEPTDNENQYKYDFQFLSHHEKEQKADKKYWYEVSRIYEYGKSEDYQRHLRSLKFNLDDEQDLIAMQTLDLLYARIHGEKIINFYQEEQQDLGYVLTTFIRVNSGGKPLEKADLLFSFVTSIFPNNFRDKVEDLIKQPDITFAIGHDFILKTILALENQDISFDASKFAKIQVNEIEKNWDTLAEAIKTTFLLLKNLGYTDKNILSKNSIIPVIYYLYHQKYQQRPLYHAINKTPKGGSDFIVQERNCIKQWFLIVGMKKIFGNSTDTRMTKIRNVIKQAIETKTQYFPLVAIKQALDITITETDIKDIISTSKYGDVSTITILSMLQPNFVEITQVDHLHPKSFFNKNKNIAIDILQDKLFNNITNLACIPSNWNRDKSDTPLAEWLKENHEILPESLLISKEMPLDIEKMEQFWEIRGQFMKNALLKLLIN